MEKLKLWEQPKNYFGENPVDYFVVYAQHRDSGLIQRANYEVFKNFLNMKAKAYMHEFSASHWAVGYVDHLLIHKDTPEEILQEIDEMLQSIDEYAILDENVFAEMESFEAQEFWESLLLDEKIEVCKRAGISIFTARQDLCPYELFEYLVTY